MSLIFIIVHCITCRFFCDKCYVFLWEIRNSCNNTTFLFSGNSNGDVLPDKEENVVPDLDYTDEAHQENTLANLNMMRKNRHFCDVILHVCALAVKRRILHKFQSSTTYS